MKTNNRRYFLFIIPFLLLAAVILAVIIRMQGFSVQELLSYTPESPLLMVLFLWGLYCLKSITMVMPLVILYITSGILFPAWEALLVTYAGLILEFTIGYFIGRRWDIQKLPEALEKHEKLTPLAKKLQSGLDWFKTHTERLSTSCFIIRFLPGPLPLDIMSIFFGASQMRYGAYIICSLLGISPGMIPWVIAGGAIATPLSKEFLIPFAIGLVISLVAFIAFRSLSHKNPPPEN